MTILMKDCGTDSIALAESLIEVRQWLMDNVSPILDPDISIYEPPNHRYEQTHTHDLKVEEPHSPVFSEALEKIPSIGGPDKHSLGMVEVLHGKEWWICVTRHRERERDSRQNEYRLYMELPDDATAVLVKLKFF
jgi:hypothetical protein